MLANNIVVFTALVGGTIATSTSDIGEPFYNCTAPTTCSLLNGGESCAVNPKCCGFPESDPIWIDNDPRDQCSVMELLCTRGIHFETSSFARCHAYLSGESTYTPADVEVPADCNYNCEEETAETAAERRRRQNPDNTVDVSLADCQQWVFDNMQLERGSADRGTGVKIAVMRSGVDYGHEAAPPLERIVRACDVSTDNQVDNIGDGKFTPPEMVIDCAEEITYDELKRVVSPVSRDDKSTSQIAGLFGPRTESGVEGIVPDADLLHYKIFDEQGFTTVSWLYNAMIDAVDNGADIILLNSAGGVECDEDYVFTPFEPKADPPLPYWESFTAEQNATWPAERLSSDIEEFEAKSPEEQAALIADLSEAIKEYNEEWEKENAVYQEEKAAFVAASRTHADGAYETMYQYVYDNNVFLMTLASTDPEKRLAQGFTNCVAHYPSVERRMRPYLVGSVDVTSRRVASQNSGNNAGGVDVVAPGGDLLFGGTAPPNLQPTMGVMAATTCQYRVMWTSTESTTQDKPNFYETNFGNTYAITHAAGVAALAVQAMNARDEEVTVSGIEKELKKYTLDTYKSWCEADDNCDEYGEGILTAKVQE